MNDLKGAGASTEDKSNPTTSPLSFPRAIGFGISIGVNNFLASLRLEHTFLYFLWAIVLYFMCARVRSFLGGWEFLVSIAPRATHLTIEWLEYVQEVVYTFLMTNIGIWTTAVYGDASRPKLPIYFLVFFFAIGIALYLHKYAQHSFFRVRV
jgi:hypothetical protein